MTTRRTFLGIIGSAAAAVGLGLPRIAGARVRRAVPAPVTDEWGWVGCGNTPGPGDEVVFKASDLNPVFHNRVSSWTLEVNRVVAPPP